MRGTDWMRIVLCGYVAGVIWFLVSVVSLSSPGGATGIRAEFSIQRDQRSESEKNGDATTRNPMLLKRLSALLLSRLATWAYRTTPWWSSRRESDGHFASRLMVPRAGSDQLATRS